MSNINRLEPEDFERIPGLFRAWEIQHLLDVGGAFQIEDAGPERCDDTLFVVFRRVNGPPAPLVAASLAAGPRR